MENFYSRLSYSFGNEDWKTELDALKIKKEDRIVCVTASGDRPLNLMMADFHDMITIDANPVQNALFDLKKAALGHLDYADYLGFIGASPFPQSSRRKFYKQLEPFLAESSIQIWNHMQNKIAGGVLYEGAVERWLKGASIFLKRIRGDKIKKLFSFDNLEKQKEFLTNEWCTYAWKRGFEISLHPLVARFVIKDPGLYEHIDPAISDVGKYLYERIHSSLNGVLAKESILISLLFKGRVDTSAFPPYLTQEGIAKIRQKIGDVKFYNTNLIAFLEESEENQFDCFSVSDVASYMSPDNFVRLIKGIIKTAKPNARFCMRQFLSNHQIPEEILHSFKRDAELEKRLESEDRCVVYRFIAGTIVK